MHVGLRGSGEAFNHGTILHNYTGSIAINNTVPHDSRLKSILNRSIMRSFGCAAHMYVDNGSWEIKVDRSCCARSILGYDK